MFLNLSLFGVVQMQKSQQIVRLLILKSVCRGEGQIIYRNATDIRVGKKSQKVLYSKSGTVSHELSQYIAYAK